MEKQTILIVEDDNDINQLLKKILQKAKYNVIQAFSGTEAVLLLEREQPDLLMLDLMLPGKSGEDVLLHLREDLKSEIPVIVLSAKAGLESKVTVLKSGADDYLTKPFEAEEVLAHVLAVLRRCSRVPKRKEKENEVYNYQNLTLYPSARKAVVGACELTLTMHEYDILYLLIQEPEKVFSREHLYEQVWKGGYYGEDNTVNVHVSNLRRKLAQADADHEYIRTVWGIGFKMA